MADIPKQIDKIKAIFDSVPFEHKENLFQYVKDYMKVETGKWLEEAKKKVEHFSNLQASLGE